MAKKKEICVREILLETGLDFTKTDISRIGENVRAAWDMIPGNKKPIKKEFEGEPGNVYPDKFRPIIINCINDYFKKHGTNTK